MIAGMYGLVDPAEQEASLIEAECLEEAMRRARINPAHAKHEPLRIGVNIVTNEHSLLLRGERCFAAAPDPNMKHQLFGGRAVIYAVNPITGQESGFGNELPMLHFAFYESEAAIEHSIATGYVDRPKVTINGVVMWTWPTPPRERMH